MPNECIRPILTKENAVNTARIALANYWAEKQTIKAGDVAVLPICDSQLADFLAKDESDITVRLIPLKRDVIFEPTDHEAFGGDTFFAHYRVKQVNEV